MGIAGLAAGYAIGIVGDSGVRGTAQQPRYVECINIGSDYEKTRTVLTAAGGQMSPRR